MRLVHWNIHHSGIGSDAKQNTPRLAKVLVDLKPDVVTMNEVEQFNGYGKQDTVAIICNILGPTWTSLFVNTSGIVKGNGQGNAILSKTPMSFPTGKGLNKTRSAAAAVINGVTIITTHLSNTSANDREVQLGQIICWDAVQKTTGPIIISGDWNAHEGNVELSSLYAFFKDSWHTQGAKSFDNSSGTHNHSRIDMVFHRGMTVNNIEIPDTRVDGVFPSDHNPVVVTFT